MRKHKLLSFLALLFLLLLAGIFYAVKIEPYRLKVEQVDLTKNNGTRPLKIVQISDLHIKKNFNYHNLDKVVTKINQQNPDVVIFSGDLYDHYALYQDNDHVSQELHKIQAKYIKLAVLGNHDRSFIAQYQLLMRNSGFTLLQNQNYYLTTSNGSKILFTGLDDGLLGQSYIPQTPNLANVKYRILLSHEPEQIFRYENYHYNVALVGHSHGGQINLPFIKHEILKETHHSTTYVSGMYHLPNSNIPEMYVNSGIGTTQLNARFGVVPKITVFNLFL